MKKYLCKKCNKQIPYKIKLSDDTVKTRSITRNHCYNCIPFGKKRSKLGNFLTTCQICNRKFEYSDKGGRSITKCSSCTTTLARKNKKQKCIDYLGGCCELCGYKKCNKALHFHHINPNTKKFGISANYDKSWTDLQNELDKCLLVCANCHAEIEDKLRAEFRI